jgi:hypothetical protein
MSISIRIVPSLLFIISLSFTGKINASGRDSVVAPSEGTRDIPYFSFGRGLAITSPDSLFLLNIRFRLQNRVGFTSDPQRYGSIHEVDARVRRMRLRFDGFVYDPRLTYVIQLSFARPDMDFENSGFPNVLRDAMVFYQFSPNFTMGMGQTKLPGNRQRVTSSGDLQFPDRSIVNGAFNVDRDFGIQAYYNRTLGQTAWILRGAVSSGEGRNASASDNGLAYTGRVEFLPFGLFSKGGDYFEGDLVREERPKLSIGVTAGRNINSRRTGGQLGLPLYEPRDFTVLMTDWLLKYRGWALSYEFLERLATNPITSVGTDLRYIYTGAGHNAQLSYFWNSGFELAGRFSVLNPTGSINSLEPKIRHYTIGGTRYVKGHRVKLQADLTYETRDGFASMAASSNIQARFQIEVGI